jgi:hypothetical protein
MKKEKMIFEWSDAWVLLSIANASKDNPAELWEIIAEGDYINRAIFTEAELKNGLYRLLASGWIVQNKNKFKTSEKYIQQIKPKLSGSYHSQIEKITKILAVKSEKYRNYIACNLKYPIFSHKIFIRAIEKYRKEFLKSHKRK